MKKRKAHTEPEEGEYEEAVQIAEPQLAPSELQQLLTAISGMENRLQAKISGVENRLEAKISALEQRLNNRFQILDQKDNYMIELISQTRMAGYARGIWGLRIPAGAEPQGRDFDFGIDEINKSVLSAYQSARENMVNSIKKLISNLDDIKTAKFEKGKGGIEFNVLGFAYNPQPRASSSSSAANQASSSLLSRKRLPWAKSGELASPVGTGEINIASHLSFATGIFEAEDLVPNAIIIVEVTTSEIAFNKTLPVSKTPIFDANQTTFALLAKAAQLERQISFAMHAFGADLAQIFAALIATRNDNRSAREAVANLFSSRFADCFPCLVAVYKLNRLSIISKNRSMNSSLPPPRHGVFIGGSKPPGGGFARFEHLAGNKYDGKRMRKAVKRRVIDYHSSIVHHMQTCAYRYKMDWIQPDKHFIINYSTPAASMETPLQAVATKYVHTSTNKIRCPINSLKWTPDGRRLITGSTSGEFTLWNGMSFNFETLLQAHDSAVRCMLWTHNDMWMVSSDHGGIIKYWQPNLNNVKAWQAHREPIRALCISPTDSKLASGSDDSTIKIWDFKEAREERMLTGHGWDVKCIDWHPSKALIASGSKDNLIKLWDPKSGQDLTTIHGHKNTISELKFNRNGNWLLAGSRDQLVKVYDLRTMKELGNYRGHKKEINSLCWHPIHETLFVTGGSEGAVYFWLVDELQPVGSLESAHDSNVWAMDWHPLGHLFVTGSNDHHTRFWTRHRPEDELNDVYIRGKTEQERIFGNLQVGGFLGQRELERQREREMEREKEYREAERRPAPPTTGTLSMPRFDWNQQQPQRPPVAAHQPQHQPLAAAHHGNHLPPPPPPPHLLPLQMPLGPDGKPLPMPPPPPPPHLIASQHQYHHNQQHFAGPMPPLGPDGQPLPFPPPPPPPPHLLPPHMMMHQQQHPPPQQPPRNDPRSRDPRRR